MRAIIKGYFTTILGVVLIALTISSLFGYTHIDSDMSDKKWYLGAMFLSGLILVTTDESIIEQTINKILEKHFGK